MVVPAEGIEVRIREVLLLVKREGKYDELVEQAKRELEVGDDFVADDGALQTP